MSRTIRKIFKGGWEPSDGKYLTEGGDAQVDNFRKNGRKMRPYSKERLPLKFRASKIDHVGGFSKGISNSDKLSTKNANRSLKKAFRQELKKEIQNELNEEI